MAKAHPIDNTYYTIKDNNSIYYKSANTMYNTLM